MGLAFVLLFWAIAGGVAAAIGSAALAGIAALFTPAGARGRPRLLRACALFPFACLAWAGAVFVFQAVVNEGLLNRDLGLGDTWHAPLSNGYHVMMIDVVDHGTVYNPVTQPGYSVVSGEDAVFGVRQLQVAGPYLLGAVDQNALEFSATPRIDGYFILDTRQGKQMKFRAEPDFVARAKKLGVTPRLRPIVEAYDEARFTWFDIVTVFLLFVPPLGVGVTLVVWGFRLNRRPVF